MVEKHTTMVELFKYPSIVFSILIAIVLSKHLLGLEFGMVTEVSTQGLKFAEHNKATDKILSEHESRLNEAYVRIKALEKDIQSAPEEAKKTEAAAFSAAQTVSDRTAQIPDILEGMVSDTTSAQLRGYIWIGNYNGKWNPTKLSGLDTGQPIEIAPQAMQQGTEYRMLGNMVVRDGLPANDREYFRGRENLGVIPRGSRVIILKAPVGIDREFAMQYWVEIETVSKL